MKAIISSQSLAQELKKLSPVVKKSTVIPILSCVKLSFENKKLTITASDLNTTVLMTTECENKDSFVIVIDHASLIDVCSKIYEPISIESKGNKVIIKSDNSKFEFAKMDDEHFPGVKDESFYLSINADEEFFLALTNANECKSDNQLQTNMNEACIHLKNDSLTIFGTDAFVAFKKDFKIKTGKEGKIMVGDQFVQMVKYFKSGKLYIGEKFVKVESGDTIVISRLSESKYCSYESIMPSELDFNFTANRSIVLGSLSLAKTAANKSTNICEINFNGGNIKLVSKDVDLGKESETIIPAIHSVGIKSIGINSSQMMKVLNLFDSEEVEMAFRGETNTIFLRPSGEPSVLSLLQPVSLL